MVKGDFNFCKIQINDFLNEIDENIDFLKDFSFSEFRNNNKFHKYKKFYYSEGAEDNFQLAKFIYILLWGDRDDNKEYTHNELKNAWASFSSSDGGLYGGETINNYTPWLGQNGKEPKGLNSHEKEIIYIFKKKYTTIGNFMVLPKRIKWKDNDVYINNKKGSYKDLPDLFYKDLFKYNNSLIAKDFCLKNFLELYFDIDNDSYRAKDVFRHELRKNDNLNKDFILDFAKKSIEIIDYRAEKMISRLKEIMEKDSNE